MLNSIVTKIKKYPKQLKHKINRIPILQNREARITEKLREQHLNYLPELTEEGRVILKLLQQEGNYITSTDKLNLVNSDCLLKTSINLVEELKFYSETNSQNYHRLGLTKSILINYPEIFLWGLEEKLLDIIENYIGLPIIYQGVSMRRDIVDGKQSGVRQWHLDWEDRRMIKIIIYLNDVDLDGGPYEYVSRDITAETIKKSKHDCFGFTPDSEMAKLVSPSNWQACTGKAGTVIISDPHNVFHRAKPSVTRDRFSLTFCYTSIRPQMIWQDKPFSQQQWELINKRINERQKNCLRERYMFD